MNKIVYRGKVFKVGEKKLNFSGTIVDYSTVLIGSCAGTVPILDDGRILLEYEYRNSINKWLYEIPAGHIDPRESPMAAAKRELEEETGYKAKRLRSLFKGYTSPGMTDELIHIFLATGLTKGKTKKEPSEQIRLRTVSLPRALSIVRRSRGIDVKTMLGILFYNQYVRGKKG